MKITIKVLWYIIISAMALAIFVLVSSKVLAHDEGQCLTDVDGNVRRSNGGWVKIIEHLKGADLKGFVHGHRHQYYDRHGNPTGQTTNFWSINVDSDDSDYLADCPTTTVDRPTTTPIRQRFGATHLVDYFLDRPTTIPVRQRFGATHLVDYFLDRPTTIPVRQSPRWVQRPHKEPSVETIPKCISIADCIEGDEVGHQIKLDKGLNLFHFSVADPNVCSVGDVYNKLRAQVGPKIMSEFQYFDNDEWVEYDRNADLVQLTTYTAFKFRMSEYKAVSLWACPLEHDAAIEFREGLNPIAFQMSIDGYVRLNDLLSLPWIDSVQFEVNGKINNRSKIGQHDDVVEIMPFQAYIVTVSRDFTFYGEVLSAPIAHRIGTLATSWGAIKQ